MIGLEERMNVFHLLGERRFLKKSLYYSPLMGSIRGQSRMLGVLGILIFF